MAGQISHLPGIGDTETAPLLATKGADSPSSENSCGKTSHSADNLSPVRKILRFVRCRYARAKLCAFGLYRNGPNQYIHSIRDRRNMKGSVPSVTPITAPMYHQGDSGLNST